MCRTEEGGSISRPSKRNALDGDGLLAGGSELGLELIDAEARLQIPKEKRKKTHKLARNSFAGDIPDPFWCVAAVCACAMCMCDRPNLNGGGRSGAQPVSDRGEAQGVDGVTSLEVRQVATPEKHEQTERERNK